jgi:hypothetical protein
MNKPDATFTQALIMLVLMQVSDWPLSLLWGVLAVLYLAVAIHQLVTRSQR